MRSFRAHPNQEIMEMLKAWIGAFALTALLAPAVVGAVELVSIDSPGLVGIKAGGFELGTGARVEIQATGRESHEDAVSSGNSWFSFGGDREDHLSAYAWILDANTRQVVWEMVARDTRAGEIGDLVEVDAEIDLPAGRYEVYLTSNHAWLEYAEDGEWSKRSVRRQMEEIEEEVEHLRVTVSADVAASEVSAFEPDGKLAHSVIAITSVGDSQYRREAFSLDREVRLEVYGLMEYPGGSDGPADFGWIVDLETGERVWDMSDRRGRQAGGASKNRLLEREVKLGPGEFMLVYGTDDSHSAEEFNGAPPHDPLAWGIQIGADSGDRSAIRSITAPTRGNPLVDFSGAGDDEFFEQAFRMNRDGVVHVYALGEGVDDGWTWVDYGWIIEASSGEAVWSMDDRNTFYAGGADKNRMFDGAVELPAGDYILFYVTDGSHSAEDWNSAAPFEPGAWGLQLFAEGDVQLLDADEIREAEGTLVSITRVRDNDRVRERFALDRETEIEIYAVGEGAGREMYDYGWIRDLDSRRVVWEMEYRDTEHAGGAQKNREVRDSITLPAGEYEVIYETDGSHSFGDWNDRQPDNPLMWGITVRAAD
jgi:hypothetical protein